MAHRQDDIRVPRVEWQPELAWTWQRRHGWLVAAVVVAAALRFFKLGDQSFYVDEMLSVHIVTSGSADWDRALDLLFGRLLVGWGSISGTLTYYWLLAPWVALFGTGEVAFRSLSALAGTLLVPVVYGIARGLATPRVGVLAAWFVAVSPALIWQSQDARAYSLAPLLSAISVWSLIRIISAHRRWWEAVFVVSSVSVVYVHPYGVLTLLAEAGWLVLIRLVGYRIHWRVLLWQSLAIMTVLPLAAAILRYPPATWSSGSFLTAVPIDVMISFSALTSWLTSISWGESFWPPIFGRGISFVLILLVFGPLLVLGAFGLAKRGDAVSTAPRPAVLMLLWLLLPTLFAVVAAAVLNDPWFNHKYTIGSHVAAAVLMAVGMSQFRRRHALVLGSLLGIVWVMSLGNYFFVQSYSASSYTRTDWRSLGSWIREAHRPGDQVLVAEPWNHGVLEWYYAGQGVRETTRRDGLLPVRVLTEPVLMEVALGHVDGAKLFLATTADNLAADPSGELLRRLEALLGPPVAEHRFAGMLQPRVFVYSLDAKHELGVRDPVQMSAP